MPTVREFAASLGNGTCSTEGLRGLNEQIFALLRPAVPDDLVSCAHTFVSVGPSAFPFLQPSAVRSLEAVVRERGEKPKLNHAYRTVAHQFVLRRWASARRCRVTIANLPGTSTHEKGIAIDIDDNERWRAVLGRHGWIHRDNDPPHFTFTGRGLSTRVLTESVRAFQRLWNLHNPTDRITEDGIFGEIETAPRLLQSPVSGF